MYRRRFVYPRKIESENTLSGRPAIIPSRAASSNETRRVAHFFARNVHAYTTPSSAWGPVMVIKGTREYIRFSQ